MYIRPDYLCSTFGARVCVYSKIIHPFFSPSPHKWLSSFSVVVRGGEVLKSLSTQHILVISWRSVLLVEEIGVP
jgi:hypothetical protein